MTAGIMFALALVFAPPQADYRNLINTYCITCHNQKTKTAGLALDMMDPANIADNAETWEKVVLKLRSGMMPPQGMPRPDQAVRSSFVSWLEARLDLASAGKPNPGRPLLHRLNRAEYANAIRDLLALDVDAETSIFFRTRA